MEKFTKEILPLYNKDGRVEDEDIARSMAKNENDYHRKESTSKYASGEEIRAHFSNKSDAEFRQMIDEEVENTGEIEHALKHLPILIEKIRSALSPEELEMFRTAAYCYESKNRSDRPFEEILREIIKK